MADMNPWEFGELDLQNTTPDFDTIRRIFVEALYNLYGMYMDLM
jgi:hypothetical protein